MAAAGLVQWTKGKTSPWLAGLPALDPCSHWGYPQNKHPLSLLGGRMGVVLSSPLGLFAHLYPLISHHMVLFIPHSLSQAVVALNICPASSPSNITLSGTSKEPEA